MFHSFCCVDFPDNDSKPKITESAVDKPTDDGKYLHFTWIDSGED